MVSTSRTRACRSEGSKVITPAILVLQKQLEVEISFPRTLRRREQSILLRLEKLHDSLGACFLEEDWKQNDEAWASFSETSIHHCSTAEVPFLPQTLFQKLLLSRNYIRN